MIVPRFWAESRLQQREGKRQVTIVRYGWSDDSEEAAKTLADERAREAMDRALAGEKLLRREPKIPYNGARGVPIREEIVSRHGDVVITRNSYGARCLNTPNVLFVDVDFMEEPVARSTAAVIFVALVLAVVIGRLAHSVAIGAALAFAVLVLGPKVASLLHARRIAASGGHEGSARSRIHRFLAAHPDWSVRLYKTPAGMRVLATHRTFSPDDPQVQECFDALGADPVYVRMCGNQQCFRARVSPKPWRIGIASHLRPRPGIWPVAQERRAVRDQWIAAYEAKAEGFAACAFLEAVGSGKVDATPRAVAELHDAMCKAEEKLPIA